MGKEKEGHDWGHPVTTTSTSASLRIRQKQIRTLKPPTESRLAAFSRALKKWQFFVIDSYCFPPVGCCTFSHVAGAPNPGSIVSLCQLHWLSLRFKSSIKLPLTCTFFFTSKFLPPFSMPSLLHHSYFYSACRSPAPLTLSSTNLFFGLFSANPSHWPWSMQTSFTRTPSLEHPLPCLFLFLWDKVLHAAPLWALGPGSLFTGSPPHFSAKAQRWLCQFSVLFVGLHLSPKRDALFKTHPWAMACLSSHFPYSPETPS